MSEAASPEPAGPVYTYRYPRAAVTADAVVVTREPRPQVLLIRRRHDPYAGAWALPGGFIDMDETLEASARRELREETGLEVGPLEQVGAYGDPGRDPRGRTVSIVYLARLDGPPPPLQAADDAADLAWHPIDDPPPLAFDHSRILADVRARLSLDGLDGSGPK